MPADRYLYEIRKAIRSDERLEDVTTMIDLLSAKRQKARADTADQADSFAATILCILFAPVKTPDYEESVASFRLRLAGISESDYLQNLFLQSMTDALLTADSADEAISLGFHSLLLSVDSPSSQSGPTPASGSAI